MAKTFREYGARSSEHRKIVVNIRSSEDRMEAADIRPLDLDAMKIRASNHTRMDMHPIIGWLIRTWMN